MIRYFLSLCVATALLSAAEPVMTVYKTKTCGCCGKWVEHLRTNGFTVEVKEVEGTEEIRRQFGVPEKLASCHTGVIGGYACGRPRAGGRSAPDVEGETEGERHCGSRNADGFARHGAGPSQGYVLRAAL